MVEEVEVNGEDRVAVDLAHGPGGDAPAGEVEGHVPPVVAPHTGGQPDLADDLAEPMQRLLGVLPGGQRHRWEQLHACPSVTRLGDAGFSIGAPGQRHAKPPPVCLAASADPAAAQISLATRSGWGAIAPQVPHVAWPRFATAARFDAATRPFPPFHARAATSSRC